MKYFILVILLLVLAAAGYWVYKSQITTPQPTPTTQTTPESATPPPSSQESSLAFPINEFKERITKKPFGIYITPQNSPVSPERFTGYHTGADVEYQDVSDDVPVLAVGDGTITLARTASGYGGVLILETEIQGEKHSVLYGHIRPSSLPEVGQTFKKGETLGLLGTGYGPETDNERRHLHFAILADNRIDLKGYVQNQSDLSGWLDPEPLFR